MNIETFISDAVRRSVEALYGELGDEQLQIQKTRREFEGDYTLVTFPLLRRSRKSPEATATEIGEYMAANVPEIASTFRSTVRSGRPASPRSPPTNVSGRLPRRAVP